MSHAKVTEEDRKLAARWGKEWLTNHLFTRKEAKASLAQLLADAIRDARLKEAMLWDAEPSADGTRDHEYHILFNSCCFTCRKERIEQLKRGEA